MDDLHVDTELLAAIRDDKDTDGTATSVECFLKTRPEVGLIDDGEVLLDISSLGHGDDGTFLKIKDSVLLEDRTEHGLDDDTWAWVGDE